MPPDVRIRVVVTGMGWMGAGTGSIETALNDLIHGTRRDLTVLAYSLTGGAEDLLDAIVERLTAGIRVTLVVDHLEGQSPRISQRLKQLAALYPSFLRVYDFGHDLPEAHLHAKLVISDRRRALVGSANLSWHGLVTYHEIGIVLEGDGVEELAVTVDRLLRNRLVRCV